MVVVVVRAVARVANMIVAEVLYLSVYLVVKMEVIVIFFWIFCVGGYAGLLVVMVAYWWWW